MPAPLKPPNQQRKSGKVRLRRKSKEPVVVASKPQRPSEPSPKAPPPNPTGGTPPAPSLVPTAQKYRPYMQRGQRDADFKYGNEILRAQAAQQNAGTFFESYKADLAKAQQAIAARYATAQAAIAPPTVGPAVQSAEGDQAAASRAIMDRAASQNLTAQGLAQEDYFTGRQTVGSAQQLQSRQQAGAEVNRLSGLRDDFALTQRDMYRDQAWTKRLEAAGFNLNEYEAQQKAADDAAKLKQDQRENRQQRRDAQNEVNQYGYAKRDWSAMTPDERRAAYKQWQESGRAPKDPAAGKTPFTRTQQADARKRFRKAYEVVRKNDNGTAAYHQDIYDTLVDADVDPIIARAAVQAYKGRVGAKTAKQLYRDYGIRVANRKPAKRPVPYTPPGPGGDVNQP